MDYLKTQKPRLLYLALDETDDWAHDGKYGLVLESYLRTDSQIRELWEWLESDPQYRGKTTLIITTDHGRGKTIADWRSHGKDIEGAQDIWVAFVGPDSPLRGEWRNAGPVFQNQIAATIARLFKLDFAELRPTAGTPIAPALGAHGSWVSVAFTLTVITNFVVMAVNNGQPPPACVTYSPLPPHFLLMFSGLYMFVLPYAAKWRGGRRNLSAS